MSKLVMFGRNQVKQQDETTSNEKDYKPLFC